MQKRNVALLHPERFAAPHPIAPEKIERAIGKALEASHSARCGAGTLDCPVGRAEPPGSGVETLGAGGGSPQPVCILDVSVPAPGSGVGTGAGSGALET